MGISGRGNGLTAASYAPLAEFAPDVADAVLELLAAEGIAAYAAPAGERSGQLVAATVDRVLDRVHVDSAARVRAQAVLDSHVDELLGAPPAPEPGATSDDEAWAQIVAAYAAPSALDPIPRRPTARDPDAEDRADSPRRADSPGPGEVTGESLETGTDGPERGPREGRLLRPARDSSDGWAPYADPPGAVDPPAPEDRDHFVPPAPPPVPRGDAVTRWAWAAVLGAPVFFFVIALTGMRLAEELLLFAAGAFVAGFVTLVARMKDRPRGDDDPDDGAVV